MIDFEKEFGHWFTGPMPSDHPDNSVHHRLKIPANIQRNPPMCEFNQNIWLSDRIIKYNNICKTCLETYTEKEISALKQYLIIKKLKS